MALEKSQFLMFGPVRSSPLVVGNGAPIMPFEGKHPQHQLPMTPHESQSNRRSLCLQTTTWVCRRKPKFMDSREKYETNLSRHREADRKPCRHVYKTLTQRCGDTAVIVSNDTFRRGREISKTLMKRYNYSS